MDSSDCALAIVSMPTHVANSAGIASVLMIRSITIFLFQLDSIAQDVKHRQRERMHALYHPWVVVNFGIGVDSKTDTATNRGSESQFLSKLRRRVDLLTSYCWRRGLGIVCT
jgi:hypothetical protein